LGEFKETVKLSRGQESKHLYRTFPFK